MQIRRLVVTAAAALTLAPALGAAQVVGPGQRRPTTPSQPPQTTPQQPAPQAPGAQGQMPEQFRKQLDQLHSRNVGAIHAATIAQQQAQDPKVKELAARIASDRNTIDQQLRDVAQRHGYTPAEPSESDRQASTSVQSQMQQGGNLDQQYVEIVIRDSVQDEQLLKDIRDAIPGKDAKFKEWADTSENVMESHKTLARQTKQALRGGQQQRSARRPPGT